MATLIDNTSGEWTANEVYELQQADPVEAAAAGASFGGIGRDNQPHQQLANRTAYLYQQQITNIANITALQGQVSALGNRQQWSNTAVFGTSGTFSWTAPAGVSLVRAIVVGPGGAGGDCAATQIAPGVTASGGGGAAGGYAEGFVPVTAGTAYTVIVGAENTGDASSFGPLSATGGGGGAILAPPIAGHGGGGGTGTGGYLNTQGGNGSNGQADTFIFAGNGAGGPWGGGGSAGLHAGEPGHAPGAGGGGAYDPYLTGTQYYGGSGAPGIVILIW